MDTGQSQRRLWRGPAAAMEGFCPLIPRPVLGILTEDFILGGLLIEPFIKRATIVQESPHRAPLPGVTHSIAEHFVYLLLRGHPPVGVGGTVHPNEFCGNIHNRERERDSWFLQKMVEEAAYTLTEALERSFMRTPMQCHDDATH